MRLTGIVLLIFLFLSYGKEECLKKQNFLYHHTMNRKYSIIQQCSDDEIEEEHVEAERWKVNKEDANEEDLNEEDAKEEYLKEEELNEEEEVPEPNNSTNPKIQTPCINLSDDEMCLYHANNGKCDINPQFMLLNCQKSCKVCMSETKFIDVGYIQHFGDFTDINDEISVLKVIRESSLYLLDNFLGNSELERLRPLCQNNHDLCSYWASLGECREFPDFMLFQCPLSCQVCDLLDINVRCPMDEDLFNDSMKPGDINAMFERITNTSDDFYRKLNPVIQSRPNQRNPLG